ncbi:Encodes a protein involved in salt tolerance [Forsythia ovata]|uniref:Encodes a protein involved in salt tolerance n=1 Tax=Forsythia ovata TaxID=205694 RepID=A0ABD1WGK2_9LAMI
MEKAKQMSGSSSSITMDDLFGPSKSPSSSTTLFGSIFGPPPPVHEKNSTHSDAISSSRKKDFEHEQGISDYMAQKSRGEFKKDKNSVDENGTNIEPCYFNSSIYYGGQEVYSPASQNNISKNIFKKDGGDVDSNENGSHSASRGNWWQGSLYY